MPPLSVWIADQNGYAPVEDAGQIPYVAVPPAWTPKLDALLPHPALQHLEGVRLEGFSGSLTPLAGRPLKKLLLEKTHVDAVPSLPTLQRLDITDCTVEDATLAKLLETTTGLKRLYVVGTPIGPRSIEAVLALPGLESVRIHGLSEVDRARLRAKLPDAMLE